MQIRQNEDGSGEIIFSEEEVKIIKQRKKLVLPKEFLKYFINLFMALFFNYQEKFSEKTKLRTTKLDKKIKAS